MINNLTDSKNRKSTRALRTGLAILLTLALASVSALSVFGAAAASDSAAASNSASASDSAAASDSVNEGEMQEKTRAAFQEFLDGKRSMIFHDDHETGTFHYLAGDEVFVDGEEYAVHDLIDKVKSAAEQLTESSEKDEEPVEIASIKYAIIDGVSLPFLTMYFEIKQPVIGTNEAYFAMHYVPGEDKIHLTLAEDRWPKSRQHINKKGIFTDTTSVSAFETSYVYRQITGSGDVHFIYSSYYDDRKVSLSDLNEWDKNVWLVSYRVSDKPDIYYTLRRSTEGDPTFVIDQFIDLTAENPAAALYMEDLEEGAQLVDHPTVIAAVLESMNKLGVTPEAFFADEPEWIEYKAKE